MADPRDTVSFEGIGARFETFKIDNSTITYDKTKVNGSAQVGLAVTQSTDDTVALVADAQRVVGKLISVESDNKATVQTEGGMTLPGGDSATLTVGGSIVGDLGAANAKGYIRLVDSAQAAELAVARGEIRNNDDTANVVVML